MEDGVSSSDLRAREALKRIKLLYGVLDKATPVLEWDTEKAEAWLPGLQDALRAVQKAEEEWAKVESHGEDEFGKLPGS